ncbi:hypothetical protein E6C27_scaffold19G002720 [Cucumis melo var. makuwa]|uniref:DUF4216 domain-containing protein n=1 Tax=Cucumis melo var. makuwa TaxID=1194695 RepID=A0A5A7SJ90_CUCMM|nr:hypothetical protein E6C27_scaffold19G002720 [Cucumis melo var. makuwa]
MLYIISSREVEFCKTLSELKVPEGYSSNIQSLVSLTDLKLYGLKSHDHHVLMQQLLSVAIRGILPKHFIGLNSSVIKKNSNVDRALSASSFIRPSKVQLDQAHLYVIQNVNDVLPYVEQHMEILRKLNSGKARSKKWIQEKHNHSFSQWLSTRVALALEVPKNSITPSLRWIAHGPSPDVATYSGYIINDYYYHTKRRDDIRRVQNSGVSITATTMQVSSSKDKNPVMSDMTFYGVIQEIWEIDYHQVSFILFKCDWVDNRSEVKVHELGFTLVDLKRIGHKSDSFILATQAKQVFYVQDSANPEWMPNVDTPNETDDTNSTYIRHDCEGRWVEKVRNITAIFMMEDSSEDEREMLPEVRKKSFVPRGPTTMSELASVRNSGQKLSIQFNEHGQPVGATSKKMQSYIGVCVRQQIPITYNSWKEVLNELKDKIYDCISKIMHDVSYRSTLWKEARKGRNNDYFDDATRDCASRIDELVATHKNEDILTDALGSKEHGGRVRGVDCFVSQSQYFITVKGKEKMITPQVEICHKEEDDSRCKSDKKRSNHSRSSIGSTNIDLDADEDTPSNKGVEGTSCQLSIGSINNIVAVATIVEDNIGCSNGKVLIDVVTRENLTIPNPVKGKIETLIKHWRVEDMVSETRSTTLSINSKMEICEVSSSIGFYRVWVLRAKFNTKNAYRQEEIDEVRTEWATFVSRFV